MASGNANANASNTNSQYATAFNGAIPQGRGDYVWNPYSKGDPYTYVDPNYLPNAGARATMEEAARAHGIKNFATPTTGLSLQNVEAITAPTAQMAQNIQQNKSPFSDSRNAAPPPNPVPKVQASGGLGGTSYTKAAPVAAPVNSLDWGNKNYGPSTKQNEGLTAAQAQSAAAPPIGPSTPGGSPSPGGVLPASSSAGISQSASAQQSPPSTTGFDTGGVVPDGTEGNAPDGGAGGDLDSAYQAAQNALQYGRSKMGLAANEPRPMPQTQSEINSNDPSAWTGRGNPPPLQMTPQKFDVRKFIQQQRSSDANDGSTQALADGGDIQPQEDAMPQGAPQAAGYVMGAGAVDPDTATALEQNVDPQGQMDPSEKVLRTIASGRSPDEQFALAQSYRQKFNRYRAFARTAAQGVQGKPGDLAASTHAATQAYANVPDGTSVTFQPHGGGVAATVKRIAGGSGGKQQGFDDGGVINPMDDAGGMGGAGDTSTTIMSPQNYQKLLTATPGTYDNMMDVGADKVIPTLGQFINDFNAKNGTNYSVGPQVGPGGQASIGPVGGPSNGTPAASPEAGTPDAPPSAAANWPQQQQAPTQPQAQSPRFVHQGAGMPVYDSANAGNPLQSDIPPDLQRTAASLFPRASQEQQRSKWIADRLAAQSEQANKVEVAKNTHLYGNQATAQGRVQASENYQNEGIQKALIGAAARAGNDPAAAARVRAMSQFIRDNQVPEDQIPAVAKRFGVDLSGRPPAPQGVQQGGGAPQIRYDNQGRPWQKLPNGQIVPYKQ